jgi:hypothetical protein
VVDFGLEPEVPDSAVGSGLGMEVPDSAVGPGLIPELLDYIVGFGRGLFDSVIDLGSGVSGSLIDSVQLSIAGDVVGCSLLFPGYCKPLHQPGSFVVIGSVEVGDVVDYSLL